MSEKGRKIVFVVSSVAVIVLAMLIIIRLDRWNADSIEREARKEEEQTEAEMREAEADELCGQRLTQYTSNGVLDLEQFLYSYSYENTESGWAGAEGTLRFDFSSSETRPIMRFANTKDEYERIVSYTPNSADLDCVSAKLGTKSFMMTRSDVTALGRILVGDYGDFDKDQ